MSVVNGHYDGSVVAAVGVVDVGWWLWLDPKALGLLEVGIRQALWHHKHGLPPGTWKVGLSGGCGSDC